MNSTTLEAAFKEWWEASYGRPPITHAVMTHVGFAAHVLQLQKNADDPTLDLLIRLVSHMAYMQGQLEAHHPLDDFEDYYWYRESVALRERVQQHLATTEASND